jgi:hypothetical protein
LLWCFQTATTRRKAVSTRRILALLVVLALSLGLCSVPAGSAPLQRTSFTGESVTAGPSFRDGDDGEDIDGGDDDRWGDLDPIGGDEDDPEATGGDEEEGNGEVGGDRIFGRVWLQIEVRTIFGILVMML